MEIFLILLNLICYADWFWLLVLQVFVPPVIREWDRYRRLRMKRQYSQGFQELLQSLMTSIQAGYTLENACRAALPELEDHREKKKDPTVLQLQKIVHGMNLGIPLEDLFYQYGKEADNEDILEFAGVMEIVKTTGGNMVAILKKTMDNFQRKMDTEEEIRVILSGIVYEKNIMMGMPLIIFAYMRVTNPVYMSCLYETLAGHILVTGILAGIFICYYWTESMIQIKA